MRSNTPPTTTTTPRPSDPQPQAAGGIQPELLTTAEAARLAGISERAWWSWSRSGIAPAPVKIGLGTRPAVRYRRSEILDWIQAGCPRVDRGGNGR
jgi:predicted DNA-binding transcriptional regulator AlpA